MKKDNLIIPCPTKEEYKNIVDKIGWYDGKKYYEYWNEYKEETCVEIKNGKIYSFCEREYYQEHYPYKLITAREYLEGRQKIGTIEVIWKDETTPKTNMDLILERLEKIEKQLK